MSIPFLRYFCAMATKGYGALIAQRRALAGLTPEQFAEKMGRDSKSYTYRLEAEDQEPTIDDVILMVSILPLTAAELLQPLGLRLSPSSAEKIPPVLLDLLAEMTPEQHQGLIGFVTGLPRGPRTGTARR